MFLVRETKAMTLSKEMIDLAGGCEQCARYQFRDGYKDAACELHVYEHQLAAVSGLRAILSTGNTERMLRAATKAHRLFGINHSTATSVWCAAMTMHFGPTGIHESRLGPDGRPNAETLRLPRVAQRMAEAADKLPGLLSSLERSCQKFAEDRGLFAGPQPSWVRYAPG